VALKVRTLAAKGATIKWGSLVIRADRQSLALLVARAELRDGASASLLARKLGCSAAKIA